MATTSILPVETIEVEILPRLPVKSLLRFKSVCKSWNSLISSDVFMIKSFRNSGRDSDTLMRYKRNVKCGRDNDEDYSYFIMGCINGLVFFDESHLRLGTVGFTIWNPATKQCLEIKYARPYQFKNFNELSGFGFDSVANDYKVMHVIIGEEGPLEGYIYSCNAGYWRKITHSKFVAPGFIHKSWEPVVVDGSPFWLITQYYDDHFNSRLIVMSFDVQREVFRLLPDLGSSGCITYKRTRKFYELLNFRDSLAVMFYSSKLWFGKTIDIHIFNEKCNDWSKTTFGPFKFLSKVPTLRMEPWFLQCLSNGDILIASGPKYKELYWVNLENYTIKSVGKGSADLCLGYNYSESLVFISGMKPFHEKEHRFQFFFLQKDWGAARSEEIKRERKRRSKRSPEERPCTELQEKKCN